MFDKHLSRELFEAVAEGRIAPSVLVRLGWQHLLDLCPHCREELEAWQRTRRRRPQSRYAGAFDRLRERLETEADHVEESVRAARRDLRTLLATPSGERVGRVERARERFRGAQLAEMLIEAGRERIPGDAAQAHDLFQTAKAVLYHSGGFDIAPELWARALANLGNAARSAWEDLGRAETHFREARALLARDRVADPLLRAEIDSLEASLRSDQGRFDEAEDLLKQAIAQYRQVNDVTRLARTLIKIGSVHGYQGKTDQTVRSVREALGLLDRDGDARLYWCGVHNQAFFLCDAGRHREARILMRENVDLYDRFPDSWTQLRRRWLEGKIAAGFGEDDVAEEALLAARQGFADQGLGFDAALVSLELAVLWARQGRHAEIKRLAEEILPLFEAQEVHREALSALMLFQQAARAERLTMEAARELAVLLRRLRREPAVPRSADPC